MKNSKALFLITVLTLLILSSCFLQKRHYMQGYNITWKNPKHKARAVAMVNPAKSAIIKKEIVEEAPVIIMPQDNNKAVNILQDKVTDNTPRKPKLIIKESLSVIDPIVSETVPVIETSLKNSTQASKEGKTKDGLGIVPGILFMLLGLLLAGLGYVFYTNLGVFFGTFFMLIFGLAGAIFFVIGLVALLVGIFS